MEKPAFCFVVMSPGIWVEVVGFHNIRGIYFEQKNVILFWSHMAPDWPLIMYSTNEVSSVWVKNQWPDFYFKNKTKPPSWIYIFLYLSSSILQIEDRINWFLSLEMNITSLFFIFKSHPTVFGNTSYTLFNNFY